MKHAILVGLLASFCLIPNVGFGQVLSTTGTHTVSICPDSTVWTWGFARLGDEPGATRKLEPVQVKGPGGVGFLEGATAVATSGGATYVILEDSSVWSWGAGTTGRLGTGNTNNQDYPTPVLGPNGIGVMDSAIAITGQYQSGFVLRANGTVWGWGWNGVGGLGDGTYFNSRNSPVQVVEITTAVPLDSIVAISSGPGFGLALDQDGTVWAWGKDNSGQIGQDVYGSYFLGAVKVKGPTGLGFLENVISVKAGDNFALALRNDGTVWAWGEGELGQLGDGTFLNSSLPVQVKDPTGLSFLQNITSIQAGDDHALALDSNGNLFTWGDNSLGQMQDPVLPASSNKPIKLTIAGTIVDILAEANSSGVFLSTTEMLMWGDNRYGNLGNGDQLVQVLSPLLVRGVDNIGTLSSVSSFSTGSENQAAVINGGQVVKWGDLAKIGLPPGGTSLEISPSPVPIYVEDTLGGANLSGIQKVSVGQNHSIALDNNGVVYGWGSTNYAQLGYPNFSWIVTPITIKYSGGGILDDVRDIEASERISMFLMNDSTVRYVGNPPSSSRNYPFLQTTSSGGPALDGIVDIAAGTAAMLALDKDSVVWGWGANYSGQLGNGNTSNQFYPVQVQNASGTGPLTGIVKIDMFEDVAFAIAVDGTVWAWGNNGSGQLGVGDNTASTLPRMVMDSSGLTPLTNIVEIAAGELHALAIAADSTAWAWGLNVRGSFGDSTTESSYLPKRVLDQTGNPLKGVIGVDAGSLLSAFHMADGSLRSCGYNLEGQTGVYPAIGETKIVQPLVPCRLFAPQAGFFASQASACEGSCIQFTDTSAFSPTKRTWVFEGGDIQGSSDPSPTVCYANPGSFSVSLIVENTVGVDSLVEMGFITINPAPVIGAGSDTSACEGDVITLAASGALSYSWKASNSLSCLNCPNPTLLVTGTNSYIVTGLDANGCSNSDTVVVEANPLPVANAGTDESVCLGDSVQLLGTGGGDYLWSPAVNASCTTCADPIIEITAAGEFVLQVTDVNGCVDSDTVAVTLAPAPVADFSFALDSSVFTITATDLSSEALEVIWTFGDGNSDTTANASHTYTANGQYEICMIAINDCGRDTTCQQVEILSVGIGEELASGLLSIDPNPSTGPVILRFSRDAHEGEVLISDLQGKVVQRIAVRPTQGMTVEAELSLPSGMYLYWFESNALRTSANYLLIRR